MAEVTYFHPEVFEQAPAFSQVYAADLHGEFRDTVSAASVRTAGFSTRDTEFSIAIRAMEDPTALESLLGELQAQQFHGSLDLFVINTIGNNITKAKQTAAVAKEWGARVFNIASDEFSYPISGQIALDEARCAYLSILSVRTKLPHDHFLHFQAAAIDNADHSKFGGLYYHDLPGVTAGPVDWLASIAQHGTDRMREGYHKQIGRDRGVMIASRCLYPVAAVRAVGGFYMSLRKGSEDAELARRLSVDGKEFWAVPEASIHHLEGKSISWMIRQKVMGMGLCTGTNPIKAFRHGLSSHQIAELGRAELSALTTSAEVTRRLESLV